jgi:site-specific DNA-methyltransferase (adenine-specific)
MTPYYDYDGATLYHGDCAAILPALDPVDLIVTSPPYDELRDYGGNGFDFERIAEPIADALKPGGVLVWVVSDQVVDGSETGNSFRQALHFMDLGLRLHDTMFYEIAGARLPDPMRYGHSVDYMFVMSNGKPKTFNPIKDVPVIPENANSGSRHTFRRLPSGEVEYRDKKTGYNTKAKRTHVWRYGTGIYRSAPDFLRAHEHPAIMPIALARDHIRSWSNECDVVLDPFAGSGTTIRAAINLRRKAVGIEIHEPYCDLTVDRLAQGVLI